MSAMLERINDPGAYQAFQHFITDAPWTAARVWRQLRTVIPDRTGVLILDGTSFPKQGTHSVGVARQVLRHVGQGRQLPGGGHGGAVDGRARLDAGRRAVSAGGVADRPSRGSVAQDSGDGSVSREVALGAHAAATGPRRRISRDRRPRRCRVWRQRHACVGTLHRAKLPYALGVSSTVTVFLGTPRLSRPRAHRHGRPRTRRLCGARVDSRAVRALAAEQPARPGASVTWRNGTNRTVEGALLCAAGDARARLAGAPLAPRSLVALRARSRHHAPHQGLPGRPAAPPRR